MIFSDIEVLFLKRLINIISSIILLILILKSSNELFLCYLYNYIKMIFELKFDMLKSILE